MPLFFFFDQGTLGWLKSCCTSASGGNGEFLLAEGAGQIRALTNDDIQPRPSCYPFDSANTVSSLGAIGN